MTDHKTNSPQVMPRRIDDHMTRARRLVENHIEHYGMVPHPDRIKEAIAQQSQESFDLGFRAAGGTVTDLRSPAANGAVTEALDAIDRQLNEMRSLKGWRLNLIRENMAKLRAALRSQPATPAESGIVEFLNAVYDAIGDIDTDKDGNVRWPVIANIQREVGEKARLLAERRSQPETANWSPIELALIWLDEQIDDAKEKQIAGFKVATQQGQLAGEKAHSRQCALYEAKQKLSELKRTQAAKPITSSDGLCPVPPAKDSAVSTETASELKGDATDSPAMRRMSDNNGSLAPAIGTTQCEDRASPDPSEIAQKLRTWRGKMPMGWYGNHTLDAAANEIDRLGVLVEGMRAAVRDAFEAGALAVHKEWVAAHDRGDGPPRGDPEFSEAANDYTAALTSTERS